VTSWNSTTEFDTKSEMIAFPGGKRLTTY